MFMLGFNEAYFTQIETHYSGDNKEAWEIRAEISNWPRNWLVKGWLEPRIPARHSLSLKTYFRAICILQCPAHHHCLAKRRKIILWRTWKGQWDIRQWKESSQFRSRLRSWNCKNARGAEAFESGGKVFWFKSEHRTEKSCQVQVQRSWEVSWTPMIHQFA